MVRGISVVLFLFFSTGWAMAGDYVACVQNQLTALGHDPGPIDGFMGRRTRGAALEFAQSDDRQKVRVGLPDLTTTTALTWCRELAAAFATVAKFKPAVQLSVIKAEDGMHRRAALVESFRTASSFFYRRYGIRTASRVDLGGSDDPRVLAQYAKELMALRGGRSDKRLQTAQKHCREEDDSIGAFTYRDQIFLCWAGAESYDLEWYQSHIKRFERIMVHEYMHHVQNELTNTKAIDYRRRNERRRLGPEWLAEGSAMVMELEFSLKAKAPRTTISVAQNYIQSHKDKLRDMRAYGSVDEVPSYEVSFVATWLLAQRAGMGSMFDYWRRIGAGDSWETAFEGTFGLPLDTFEAEFQTLRQDFDAAVAFAAAEE